MSKNKTINKKTTQMFICVCERLCCKKDPDEDEYYEPGPSGSGIEVCGFIILFICAALGIAFPLIYPIGDVGNAIGFVMVAIFVVGLVIFIWSCCDWRCCVCKRANQKQQEQPTDIENPPIKMETQPTNETKK